MTDFKKPDAAPGSDCRTNMALSIAGMIAIVALTLGCESDPILAPQQEKQSGGSYGLVAFDPQGREKALNTKGDDDSPAPRNPQRF